MGLFTDDRTVKIRAILADAIALNDKCNVVRRKVGAHALDFTASLLPLAIWLAASDGFVDAKEAKIIAGFNPSLRYTPQSINGALANRQITSDVVMRSLIEDVQIVEGITAHLGESHDPADNPIIRLVKRVAEVVLMSDGQLSPAERARFDSIKTELLQVAQDARAHLVSTGAAPSAGSALGPASEERLAEIRAIVADTIALNEKVNVILRQADADTAVWTVALVPLAVWVAGADGVVDQEELRLVSAFNPHQSYSLQSVNTALKEVYASDPIINHIATLVRLSDSLRDRLGQDWAPEDNPIIGIVRRVGAVMTSPNGDPVPANQARTDLIVSELTQIATAFRAASADTPASSGPGGGVIADPDDTLEKAMADLEALVGLASVKAEVSTLVNLAKVNQMRKSRGLAAPELAHHLVFSGNPGTGKTTVARIIARIYRHLGLVSKGQMVEADRSQLVAGYIGQTALKVQDVVGKATGGVLFIDEAYALAGKGAQDFGGEAVETLLKLMEDRRDDLIVVAAGYTDNMQDFLGSNPGLASRFPKTIVFPDYSAEEMTEIFRRMAKSAGYVLGEGIDDLVRRACQGRLDAGSRDFANAREVRNLLERAMQMQANRLASHPELTDEALSLLIEEDIPAPAPVAA